jgi:uncharacterized membrane protein
MFHQRLDGLLKSAVEREIVTPGAADALRDLARDQIKERGAVTLAAVFGWVGGLAVVFGSILLVAANWDGISDGMKLAGFLVLLAGTHAAGFALTKSGLPYEKTAASFHFIGAGLFLAGIGLVAQIYHLNGRPPNAVLLWFLGIAPLAVLVRSASIGVMSLLAFLAWIHGEGVFDGSPVKMVSSFAAHLVIEAGIAAALIGFSGLVQKAEPRMASAMRRCGALMLFYTVYLLGFYRYFDHSRGWYGESHEGAALLPLASLGLGAIGLVVGGRGLSPGSPWLRNRLLVLLGVTLAVAAAILGVEQGWIAPGPNVEFWDFGWTRHHALAGWILTIFSWIVWFLLGLWSIAWGAKSDRKAYVNLGVLAIGVGIITRFLDLMGSMAETGTIFVIGGGVLLATGYAMERWRRRIVRDMLAGKAVS